MKSLYASPLRVYVAIAMLAIAGIWAGLNLPVSLFPNSSQPTVSVNVNYGSMTAREFQQQFGNSLESRLAAINASGLKVERIESTYRTNSLGIEMKFKWGNPAELAETEARNVASSAIVGATQEVRDSLSAYNWGENQGFLAISFFSNERDPESLHKILDPLLKAKLAKVPDAEGAGLWNPMQKQVRVTLNPEAMANLGVLPSDVESAVKNGFVSRTGGSLTVESQNLQIQMPSTVNSVADLTQTLVRGSSGKAFPLSQVAHVDFGPNTESNRSFLTNGAKSLILYASPKAGGNVKRMAEDILDIVKEESPNFPKDINYRVLIDPSKFIRQAVNNVVHEVAIGSLLAVTILFFFIGSLKNVITAAIEIPISMVLALLLMNLFDININLISLGGLALSAGMNVDASVVVMENIFRHFKEWKGPLDAQTRFRIVVKAVNEVRMPVIASTIASLVVFAPLAFTSELSHAILGDLVKAVVFSHGFSAVVALVLVPTVRLQLMSLEKGHKEHKSPIEGSLIRLENFYARSLGRFIGSRTATWATYVGLLAILVSLVIFAVPRLPKEVIGTPDTDIVGLSISSQSNTHFSQMELLAQESEAQVLTELGSKLSDTFTQIHSARNASIMIILKNKKDMNDVKTALEARFKTSPFVRFYVYDWNPSELPIPDPDHLRLAVRGGSEQDNVAIARKLRDHLMEKKIYEHVWSIPNVEPVRDIFVEPNLQQWALLGSQGTRLTPSDVLDITRVATDGRSLNSMTIEGQSVPVFMKYSKDYITHFEDLTALPISIGSRVVPLRAVAKIEQRERPPLIYRDDHREMVVIIGRLARTEKNKVEERRVEANGIIAAWEKETFKDWPAEKLRPTVTFEDPDKSITNAMSQLQLAILWSVVLIFVTMIFQFGSLVEPLLVLVSVPLGFIGVLVSLFVFKSTVSLNSVLGVILLNGIAVANSIILVDFIKRLCAEGLSPKEAALEAARKRLRPILITSLTTVLGMLPIAFGFGEGGKILQPLGIAVAGGLWVSMGLTLFVVPTLHVAYLNRKASPKKSRFSFFKFSKIKPVESQSPHTASETVP